MNKSKHHKAPCSWAFPPQAWSLSTPRDWIPTILLPSMPRLGLLPELATSKQAGCFPIPQTQCHRGLQLGALVSVSSLWEGVFPSVAASANTHTLTHTPGHPIAGPRRLFVPPGHPGNCRAGTGWPRARTAPPGPAPDQPQHAQGTCLRSLPGRRRLAPPHAQTRAGRRRHTPRPPC